MSHDQTLTRSSATSLQYEQVRVSSLNSIGEEGMVDKIGEAGDEGRRVCEGDFGEAQEEERNFPGEHGSVNVLAGDVFNGGIFVAVPGEEGED